MKIKKLKQEEEYFYPATISAAIKDENFVDNDGLVMTQRDINQDYNNRVNSIESAYVKDVQMGGKSIVNDRLVNITKLVTDNIDIENDVDGSKTRLTNKYIQLGKGHTINVADGFDYVDYYTIGTTNTINVNSKYIPSLAMGIQNTVSSALGTVIGANNTSNYGFYNYIFGDYNTYSDDNTAYVGDNNWSNFIIGKSNTITNGYYNISLGISNTITTSKSKTDTCHENSILGIKNELTDSYRSSILGDSNNIVNSQLSYVVGVTNDISYGNRCIVLGSSNHILYEYGDSKEQSAILGSFNTITSDYSFAIGDGNELAGDGSSALGYRNITQNLREVATGYLNSSTTGVTKFSIGNGYRDDTTIVRHNLLYANESGDLYIVEKTPTDDSSLLYYEAPMKRLQTWLNEKADINGTTVIQATGYTTVDQSQYGLLGNNAEVILAMSDSDVDLVINEVFD